MKSLQTLRVHPNREWDESCKITRTTVPALDQILGVAFPVLDKGFVRVIDYMGDDRAICEAARVSYGEGTKTVTDDQGLINYLMRHRHTSPFEMCEIKLHCKMPIFVARQWIRHRTAKVNEYSGRYSEMKSEFYIPEQEDLAYQSTTNKQGRSGVLEPDHAESVQERIQNYSQMLHDRYGVFLTEDELSRELARIVLPLNTYTEFYWKIDLHNLLHFLSLRADSHAQKEIRDYANLILAICLEWVPQTVKAFINYRMNAFTFSQQEQVLLFDALNYDESGYWHTRALQLGMSQGEMREFEAKLKKLQGEE